MDVVKLPFLESKVIRNASYMFIGVGDMLSRLFPYTEMNLKHSGITDKYKLNDREYLSIAFFLFLMSFILSSLIIAALLSIGGSQKLVIAPILGAFVGLGMYFYMMAYPKSIVNKRVKYLERNLLFALRSILVQIRSGVPIFNAMVSVAMEDYGPISAEFKTVVEKVNAGTPVVEALEELAVRNPSVYFRRVLWQLVNGMKSGSDVGNNISDSIKSLSKEQLVEIKRYQSTLNPLAMMYMMVAVIMPSLGITMLIILSTFPGMEEIGNKRTFWGLFALIIIMQFIFMGIIKSRRPNLIGG